MLGGELQREVGESDAYLGEDDPRALGELTKGGEERVAKGEEVRFWQRVEVVTDLRAAEQGA